MKKFFKSDLFKCRIFTFIEGFLGVTSSSILLDIKDINALKIFLTSGIIAGVSAVINLLKLKIKKDEW